MNQSALTLAGGAHAGPLFVPRLRRPLVRPKGKEGIVHRAQTVRATPRWLTADDMREIAKAYAEARRLTLLTGELHVVDHIVPKCGTTVCGLHVPWNLRVMHWRENAIKGATWWPNMWNEQMELTI
jgi:hypothetical protein